MAPLLKRALCVLAAAVCGTQTCAAQSRAAEASDRHHWYVELDTAYVAASSPLPSWTSGGLGKLRNAENDDGVVASRLFGEYRGRLNERWSATVVADYVDDASSGIDVVEAFFDWRPVSTSRNRHSLRIGAFYPPLSLENGARGWQSPYTYSFSAANTWLGEEIRPIGAEWTLRRRLGERGDADLRVFAGAFYGNDPAGTLLFWRGWSLHDRQTRLNDELALPPNPVFDAQFAFQGYSQQTLEPVAEIDERPGAYAGVEWRSGERVLLQAAYWDNRADPWSFESGQWSWYTEFSQIGAQITLPLELGLIVQRLSGETDWLTQAFADGTRGPVSSLVTDEFSTTFVLLTRLFGGAHRASVRYEEFAIERDVGPIWVPDRGRAWTAAYRYEHSDRLSAGVEWLEIRSRRDLWPIAYALPLRAEERTLRLRFDFKLTRPAR